MRLMAVCHDSVGIGHLRRTMAIAESAARAIPSCRVLVVSGASYQANFGLPNRVDYVKLPSLCKGPDYRYCAKTLGTSLQDTVALRSALLTATAATFRPDVFLIDKSPLGVHGEAETALRLVKDRFPATRVVFGMRDIEDAPERTIQEWRKGRHIDALKHLVDEVWVYGDPEVFDVADAYQLPSEIVCKLRYVGYISRAPCDHDPSPTNGTQAWHVLLTVGGGTDGFRLIDQFLLDPPRQAGGRRIETTIVGGPDLPRPEAEQFRRRASETDHVEFIDFLPCMSCAYRRADLVLCMGGYNTMLEVTRLGRAALVYPRVEPRLEQYIRARRFAAIGLCEALDPNRMSPAAIRAAIERTLLQERPVPRRSLDLGGLSHVTERLSEIEESLRDSMAVYV